MGWGPEVHVLSPSICLEEREREKARKWTLRSPHPMACPSPRPPAQPRRCPLGLALGPQLNSSKWSCPPNLSHPLRWTPLLPPLSAPPVVSPLSSRPPRACHFWSSPRSHLPACTWLSPLGAGRSGGPGGCGSSSPPSRGLPYPPGSAPSLVDVAEEGGSIECALPGEKGRSGHHISGPGLEAR